MCDYSLEHKLSREAKANDRLITTQFHDTPTRGFTEAGGDSNVAVCLLPGTELAFEQEVRTLLPLHHALLAGPFKTIPHKTARFRHVNEDRKHAHHDALEFPDGSQVLVAMLIPGQIASILQLPANTVPAAEKPAQPTIIERVQQAFENAFGG